MKTAERILRLLANEEHLYAHHGVVCSHESAFTRLGEVLDQFKKLSEKDFDEWLKEEHRKSI